MAKPRHERTKGAPPGNRSALEGAAWQAASWQVCETPALFCVLGDRQHVARRAGWGTESGPDLRKHLCGRGWDRTSGLSLWPLLCEGKGIGFTGHTERDTLGRKGLLSRSVVAATAIGRPDVPDRLAPFLRPCTATSAQGFHAGKEGAGVVVIKSRTAGKGVIPLGIEHIGHEMVPGSTLR